AAWSEGALPQGQTGRRRSGQRPHAGKLESWTLLGAGLRFLRGANLLLPEERLWMIRRRCQNLVHNLRGLLVLPVLPKGIHSCAQDLLRCWSRHWRLGGLAQLQPHLGCLAFELRTAGHIGKSFPGVFEMRFQFGGGLARALAEACEGQLYSRRFQVRRGNPRRRWE